MERSGRAFFDCASEAGTSDEPHSFGVSSTPTELEYDFYDALDVFAASEAYQVPSATITHVGVLGEFTRFHFALGSGLSSQVVQHVTNDETNQILPANTVLALKIFVSRPVVDSNSAARASQSDVFATIVREIKAIAHPLLRSHENIAQLRFIAWNEAQPFPMLAMELGNYGTLDHVIRSRGSDSSTFSSHQKQHITLDIAVGLREIHRAGFIHGDLKPENIIIMNHPDPNRGVIAKLLDFGGSSDDIQGGPTHFTPLWCAPEVQGQKSFIDWEKCDIYSYGLVIASIWGRNTTDQLYGVQGSSTQLQTSVLSTFASTNPPTSNFDLMMRVRKMQTLDWKDTNSLISVLRSRLVAKVQSNDLDVPQLVGIILSTLHTEHSMRPTTQEIIEMLQPVFKRLIRKVPITVNQYCTR